MTTDDRLHFLRRSNHSSGSQPIKPRLREDPGKTGFLSYSEPSAPDAMVSRLVVIKRDGHRYSYPYSHLGLIEMPTADTLIIYSSAWDFGPIVVKGRGMAHLAHLLDTQRLLCIRELTHPDFAEGEVAVVSISVNVSRD
jgi:hypothetical protein